MMELSVNSKYIKISGKIELPPEKNLAIDEDVTLLCKGQVVKAEQGSNQDGTCDLVLKVKLISAVLQ